MARNYSNTSVQTTITSGVDDIETALTVADATGYPSAPFAIVADPGSATSEEVLLVTAKAGAVFTVTRGYDGTMGKAHSSGATVIHAAIAADFTDAAAHIADTNNPHSVTAAQVGAYASGDVDTLLLSYLPSADYDWSTLPNKPSAFTPTAHASTHAAAGGDPLTLSQSQVTNLVTDLAGKAATSHTHAESDVTNLVTDLAAKAPLASPALTGTPTAPTATGGTNTTQIATTAFVVAGFQPLDAELTAIAGLTSAADKGIQFTGSGTAGTYDLTPAGKALLDDADATAQRTTLGLGTAATAASTDFVSATTTRSANTILAGPASGSAAAPTFRAAVAADIPLTLTTTTINPSANAALTISATGATSGTRLIVGGSATGNRQSYIDLLGDDVNATGLQILRDAGASGVSVLDHRGTGALRLYAANAGSVEVYTSGTRRLTVSANGELLHGGTSFPTSPSTGARFYRTDLGWECYYDGTRWLTVQEFAATLGQTENAIVANGSYLIGPIRTDYAVYVTRTAVATIVITTNNGSNYWSWSVRGVNNTYGSTTTLASADTSAVAATTWVFTEATVNSAPTNHAGFDISFVKTSAPGGLILSATVYYRMIVT